MGSVSRLALLLTSLVMLGWQQVALSQADINLPPRQDTKSGTGVSFKSGSFSLDGLVDLSIGGSGIAGLQLVRSYSSSLSPGVADNTNAQGWTYNTVANIARNLRTYRPDEMPPPDPRRIPLTYTVSTGAKTVSFMGTNANVPPATYIPISPGGETLVFTQLGTGLPGSGSSFTFIDSDGSVYVFPYTSQSRLQSVTYPDGTRLDFTYVVAPTSNTVTKSIISNRGYAILFDGPSKACVVNMAETYITATSSCPTGAQSVTYSYTTSTFNAGVKNLTGAANALGQTTTYAYVGADHLGCVQEPGQTVCKISNTYNVCLPPPGPNPPPNLRYSDQVVSQTTGTAEVYTYSYQFFGAYEYCSDFSGYGAVTTLVSPGNATTIVSANGAGLPTSIIDPLSRSTGIVYYGNSTVEWEESLPQRQTVPEGNSQAVIFDPRANVTEKRVQAKPGSGLADRVFIASYPATCTNRKTCNKPDYTIDPRGSRSDYTYDPNHGGILTETSPADASGVRPQKRYSYTQLYAWIKNSSGGFVQAATPVWMLTGTSECRTLASCAGSADETRTSISYGSPGTANNLLPTSTTVSSGDNLLSATTTLTYDFTGNVLTVDGPLAGSADTTRYRYDALRRVVGEISPDPDGAGPLPHRASRTTYDAAGRRVKVESGTVNGQSDADWPGFVALESIDSVYDVMGRKLKDTRSGGASVFGVTQFSYDASGRLDCTAVRMDPAQWGSQPNACAPQTSGPHGPDRITRNVYNAAGEVVKVQVALGTSLQTDEEVSTYTSNGQLSTYTDGEGNRTSYEYDGHDRLQRTRYPDKVNKGSSSASDFEEFAYDVSGNTTQRRLRDGQLIGFGYDSLNRATLKDLPAPELDVSTSYDLQGRPLQTVQGVAITATWDALGRNKSESGPQGTMTYEYDAAGRRTRATWPDSFYVTHDYLVTGEIAAIREYGATSGIGVLASFAYDSQGRRTSITRGNGTTTRYSYDAISRLGALSHDLATTTHDVSSSFAYNPASQIITWTRSNDAYAWKAHYNLNRTYAVNGLNQLTTGGGVTFGYDGRGNLTSQGTGSYSYTTENRLITGPNGAAFSYDPAGRLSQSSGSSGTTRFQYDGTDLVAEYNASNQLQRRYVHGPGADEPLVWYEGAGTSDRRWLHQDERGSTVAVSNAAGGMLAVNAYDEYGIPASGNLGRFQYTGQTWLPDVGMYYYKARMYSPTLGRFLQTDPIGYDDDLNLYAYVGNDPLNATDPTGEVGVAGVVYGAIAGAAGGYIASGGTVREKIVGTLAGALAGGAVGFLFPQASGFAGGAAAGALASAGGQAFGSAANAAIDKGVTNVGFGDVKVDPIVTAAGALGAGVGKLVGEGVASLTAQKIVGNTLQAAGTPTASGLAAGAIAEGAIIGAAEKYAPKVNDVIAKAPIEAKAFTEEDKPLRR